jgi:hypothetical protein
LNIKEMPTEVNIRKRFKVKEIVRMARDLMAITYRLKMNRWYYKQIIQLYACTLRNGNPETASLPKTSIKQTSL